MNSFFTFWILKPKSNYWIFLPLGYTFFLQILTGFPKPESLKKFDANDLFIRFSEELFGYPFWLQDLSHLPLFFALAWLWSWKLGPINGFTNLFQNKAFLISAIYAVVNEMAQEFIPDRFPSVGRLNYELIRGVFGSVYTLAFHPEIFPLSDLITYTGYSFLIAPSLSSNVG
jgi:hypothetical protein